jgi:hypothetical protein
MYYMAEPVTTPVYSDISRLKHFEFLRRRDLSSEEIGAFHEVVLRNFSSIRETVNEGHRTFGEFLTLLDKADKFKHWIVKTNPDAGFPQNYLREVTEGTWAERLPAKVIRFAVAQGVRFHSWRQRRLTSRSIDWLVVGGRTILYKVRIGTSWNRDDQFAASR